MRYRRKKRLCRKMVQQLFEFRLRKRKHGQTILKAVFYTRGFIKLPAIRRFKDYIHIGNT